MAKWTPSKIWRDQDAYVIGGGPSLEHFDWDRLRGRHTVGCSSAYTLGVAICEVCVFTDLQPFFKEHERGLSGFKGLVVTNNSNLEKHPSPWLKWMPRKLTGLYPDALGFNYSCGATAINLALLFGARRVFLLGMDLGAVGGKANWHPGGKVAEKERYSKFRLGFGNVARALPKVFPGQQVVNIHDFNKLSCFPTVSVAHHFEEPV